MNIYVGLWKLGLEIFICYSLYQRFTLLRDDTISILFVCQTQYQRQCCIFDISSAVNRFFLNMEEDTKDYANHNFGIIRRHTEQAFPLILKSYLG